MVRFVISNLALNQFEMRIEFDQEAHDIPITEKELDALKIQINEQEEINKMRVKIEKLKRQIRIVEIAKTNADNPDEEEGFEEEIRNLKHQLWKLEHSNGDKLS